MSILIILLHALCNFLVGLTILRTLDVKLGRIIRLPIAIVIGAFLETMLGFILIWLNIYEFISFYILTSIAILFWGYNLYKKKEIVSFNFTFPKLNFLEWILLIPIVATVFTSLYATISFPLYFDDAMTHWSGRGKALYGHVNWSMDAASKHFLGQQFGFEEYPLFVVVWRAITGHLNGGWNDIIAKGDSWLFFVMLLISVYTIINEQTKKKFAALGGTLIVASLPLIWYHSISGYSEIVVACLLSMIAYCLLNKHILIAALLTACTIWTKNEGLFIFLPGFASCLCLFSLISSKFDIKDSVLSSVRYFFLSILFISPWLIFRLIKGVALTVPLKPENYYHPGAIDMFIEMLFSNPSNSILWGCFFFIALVGILKIFKHPPSIFIASFVILCLFLFIYVFCFTGSNIFLVNQMTIHRSFFQIAPIAVILIFQVAFAEEIKSLDN